MKFFSSDKLKEFGIKSVKIFETLQNISFIIKYEKGGKFERHQDIGKGTEWRYKTLIVQLSNENDYEGGDLSIWDKNNNEIKIGKVQITVLMTRKTSIEKYPSSIRYNPIVKADNYTIIISNNI